MTTELDVLNEILANDKVVRVTEEDEHPPNNIVCGSRPAVTGSKQIKCACGAILWASPRAQAMIAKHPDAPVLCVHCAKKILEHLNTAAPGEVN